MAHEASREGRVIWNGWSACPRLHAGTGWAAARCTIASLIHGVVPRREVVLVPTSLWFFDVGGFDYLRRVAILYHKGMLPVPNEELALP